MKMAPAKGTRLTVALGIMLVILTISNVLLIRQNLQMRAVLNKLHPPSENLQVGDIVPSFSGPGLHGEQFEVNYTGKERKRVLLYFSPNCPYSREQLKYWQELASKADNTRFDILGLVANYEDKAQIDEYLHLSNPASTTQSLLPVAVISEEIHRLYKLSVTPTTLVVSNDGKVEQVWVGRWNDDDTAKAGVFFGFDFTQSLASKR